MFLNHKERKEKAFTLIELLVVIAILAVLAVAVTLILNPAELIRQGRDSIRLSDLATINKALGLYQTDQIAKWMGTSTIVYISHPFHQDGHITARPPPPTPMLMEQAGFQLILPPCLSHRL